MKKILLMTMMVLGISISGFAKPAIKSTVLSTYVSMMDTIHIYHSALKDDYEGVYKGEQFISILKQLYLQAVVSREASIYKLGDSYQREILDRLLNKYFGKGRQLTTAEKLRILNGSVVEKMPTDFATNPRYAGKIQRYKSDGTVSTWVRPVADDEEWVTYQGIPYMIVDCGNGYELNRINQAQYAWKKADQQSGSTSEADAKAEVTVNINYPQPQAPVQAPQCFIASFTASPSTVAPGQNVILQWDMNCEGIITAPGMQPVYTRDYPSHTYVVNPMCTTVYTLTSMNSGQKVSITVSVYNANYCCSTPTASKSKGGGATYYIIGGGLVAGGGADLLSKKKTPAPVETQYNTAFPPYQGGSGSSGTSGGSGGQVIVAFRPSVAQQFAREAIIPKHSKLSFTVFSYALSFK